MLAAGDTSLLTMKALEGGITINDSKKGIAVANQANVAVMVAVDSKA